MALVYPLMAGGIAPKDYPFVCYSITGYSGGGKKMIAEYEDKDRAPELDSPRQYGTTQQHKHLKEMKAIAGLAQEPIFAPIVGDFYSGMTVSVPVFGSQLQKKMTVASMKEYFMNYYAGNPMIKVLEETPAYIGTNNMSGRDSMEIMVSGNDDRILLAARFDNLGKGASGAAIQCMNIMLGLDETTGLER
jgi:N-acetyl-gamma-glutamyl-phosphate reductase